MQLASDAELSPVSRGKDVAHLKLCLKARLTAEGAVFALGLALANS